MKILNESGSEEASAAKHRSRLISQGVLVGCGVISVRRETRWITTPFFLVFLVVQIKRVYDKFLYTTAALH